jgi:hypothetical protein
VCVRRPVQRLVLRLALDLVPALVLDLVPALVLVRLLDPVLVRVGLPVLVRVGLPGHRSQCHSKRRSELCEEESSHFQYCTGTYNPSGWRGQNREPIPDCAVLG